jgi:serine phosphatase RsbU (regulator of sigma subunit)
VDPDPASVVGRLDRMVVRYGTEQLVTLVYAVADAATGTLVMTNAGHPPPSLVREDGTVAQLPLADGPPLGVSRLAREQRTVSLAVGDTLLLFTDGLVERRGEDIDDGLARLARALPALAAPDPGAGLRRVVESVRDETYDDDIAALALRRID